MLVSKAFHNTISNIHLSILAKLPKKAVEISKYFKKSENNGKKLYAQASTNSLNTARETLKIKEVFSNLQNKKIKNIQKIISSKNKDKPKMNMTIKELSRKQVIIPINKKNAANFIKDLSLYVTNINRSLKSIKSEIITDFIHLDSKEVVITTNKVAGALNLQTIEKYIKNINNIEAN